MYVISLEFIGAIIFATVIAAITSVVTSMDMNVRKTAEQLDAVASFVAMRQFPKALGRKIRRHFRNFYSRKSAIDESKIFSELSTTLREQVSEYIVNEILGKRSFFNSVNRELWPELLPLLRPMSFEQKESVCTRGIAATEMYVVISGRFVGKLQVEDQERERNIFKGDSVNTLHVLGIWYKCIESVEAITAGETYAISEQDFMSLFSSDSYQTSFEKLQRREVKKFKMEPSEGAPWGRPLCFNFSSVEFSVVQLRGSFLALGENDLKSPLSKLLVWIVVELADATTGAPFVLEEVVDEIWRHTTTPRALDSIDGQGIGELSYGDKEGVSDTIRWDDISVPFERASLRVSVYMLDKKGASILVGRGFLSLEEVNNKATPAISGESKASDSANKPLPSTTVSSVEPHHSKEKELSTWLPLTNTLVQTGDSNGNEIPAGASLDGLRTHKFDPGSKGLIGEGLYLRVSARPAEHHRALPSRQMSMKGRNKKSWNPGAHPPSAFSNGPTDVTSELELAGEFC